MICLLSIALIIEIITLSQAQQGNSTYNGTTYVVTTREVPPWIVMKEDGSAYEGFVVDILKEIGNNLGFQFTMHPVKDGTYGRQRTDSTWSGMIGELTRGEADIAAADIAITEKRRTAVDFSYHFQMGGYRILIKKPQVVHHSLKVLFEPLSLGVWLLIMVICLVVGAFLFIINKFSPSEWSKLPEDEDPLGARFSFDIKNCFFFVHSTLTWQGYKEAPRSPAGRILTTFWFSFVFFLIVAYTANLTAMFLARDPELPVVPFKTFQEMATQTEVSYGTISNSNLINEMKTSPDPLYQRMVAYMETSFTNVHSFKEGIQEVKNSKQGFAAIVESLGGEYVTARDCDLMMVGERVFQYLLGFACQKGSGLCRDISAQLLLMRENGDLHLLENKWWQTRGAKACPATSLNNYLSRQETAKVTARPLTIADLSLAFLLLLIAIVLAAVLLIVEVLVHRYRKKKGSSNLNMEPVRMTESNGGGQTSELNAVEDVSEKAPIAAAEP